MKRIVKIVLALLCVVICVTAVVLAVDIELNLKVRKRAHAFFEGYEQVEPEIRAQSFRISESGLTVDPHSQWVIEQREATGRAYVDSAEFNRGNVSSGYDAERGILSLVGPEHRLEIHKGGDAPAVVFADGEPIQETVDIQEVDDRCYVDLTALLKTEIGAYFGLYERSYTPGGPLLIASHYDVYPVGTLQKGTWLFENQEDLDAYREKWRTDAFFYNGASLFQKTPILSVLSAQPALVFPEGDRAARVVTVSGEVGVVDVARIEMTGTEGEALRRDHITREGHVVLTWEAVYSANPKTENIPEMAGLTVISPTWYALSDAEGAVSSKASSDYVQWAKGRGYEVWALVSNDFDIDRTHAFLKNAPARRRFIETMISESKAYGYTGINVDFEHIYRADREALTHFINELALACSQHQLVLSMDVTVMGGSDNWSKCYDHQRLGAIVDYLVVMAYDEYWASSPVSGPVASYDWVLKHMSALAERVDPERIIMGVPLYTRVWREYPSVEKANAERTKSTAIGMSAQNALIEKYQLKPIWDDVDKLAYATFFEADAQVKLWIEDARSMRAKLDIVRQLKLKGVGAWRRGFETPDIWPIFQDLNP